MGPESAQPTPSQRPKVREMTEEERLDAEDAARAAMFKQLYRPKSNPLRFNIMARALFSYVGNNAGTASGRAGGLELDLGATLNSFGFALTLHGKGALVSFPEDRKTELLGFFGGGPTISLGRLAYLQNGFLDLRLGYDFLYSPTRQLDRVGDVDPDANVQNRAPHGPRLNLNMGLMLNQAGSRKRFQAIGATVGYQALVGSLNGEIPFMNMLTFGLTYWNG